MTIETLSGDVVKWPLERPRRWMSNMKMEENRWMELVKYQC